MGSRDFVSASMVLLKVVVEVDARGVGFAAVGVGAGVGMCLREVVFR